MRTRFIDIETTGLDANDDEILEVAVLDADGTVILDTLVQPLRHQSWPVAEAIHGISARDVRNAPILAELRAHIRQAVDGCLVVAYRAEFERAFLGDLLDPAREIQCAQAAFVAVNGCAPHPPLIHAAATAGFVWPGSPHRALQDCRATSAVWWYTQAAARPQRAAQAAREAIA